MTLGWLWLVMGSALSFGALAGFLAHRKNRDVYGWIAGGVLLSALAPLALLALPKRKTPVDRVERALLRFSAAAADLLSRALRAGLLERERYRGVGVAAAIALASALAMIFFYAPEDRSLGISQKIFYIHVPSAWISFVAFFFLFAGSALYLWQRRLLWDDLARAAAEIGTLLGTVMLVTGSLWGRAAWGPDFGFWTWDPRLTSSFFLWLIYLAYLLVRSFAVSPQRGALFGAILGLVGLPDIYLIHIAVEKFGGMHPEAIVARPEGPQMPGEMVATLLVSLAAFTLLAAALAGQRMRLAEIERNRAR
ncbi:MAG: cytochrome c biogenesis protein [Vicinamibacteria bacterium]